MDENGNQSAVHLRLLAETATQLIGGSDPGHVVQRLFRLIASQLGLDVCFHFALADDEPALRLDSYVGVSEETAARLARLEFGQAVCGTVALRREPMVVVDLQKSDDPLAQLVKRLGLQAYACNPLISNGELLGTLSFGARGRDRFGEAELSFFQAITQIVAAVKARNAAQDKLTNSERRAHAAMEGADLGAWEVDFASGTTHWDDRTRELLGRSGDEAASYEHFLELVDQNDRRLIVEQLQSALDPTGKGKFDAECRIRRPDGSMAWLSCRGQAYFADDEARRPIRLVGTVLEITDRKLAEQRQDLLIAELDHRVKNALAKTQSLARQVLKPGERLDRYERLLLRLGETQQLLSKRPDGQVSLRQLLERELAPYRATGEARAQLAGPETLLPAQAAQTLALAFHELATNAVKHGAYSAPAGAVVVEWRITDGRLALTWRETGGPAVRPPERHGFGTQLLTRGVAYELLGEVRLSYPVEGLVCSMEIPILGHGVQSLSGAGRSGVQPRGTR